MDYEALGMKAGIENPPAAGYRRETLLPLPNAAAGDL